MVGGKGRGGAGIRSAWITSLMVSSELVGTRDHRHPPHLTRALPLNCLISSLLV